MGPPLGMGLVSTLLGLELEALVLKYELDPDRTLLLVRGAMREVAFVRGATVLVRDEVVAGRAFVGGYSTPRRGVKSASAFVSNCSFSPA